jgi:hypothetical protein
LGEHHCSHADRLKLANRLHFIDHSHDLHDRGARAGASNGNNSRPSGSIAFRKELTSDSSNWRATVCTDTLCGRVRTVNRCARCANVRVNQPPKAMARTPRMIRAEAAI